MRRTSSRPDGVRGEGCDHSGALPRLSPSGSPYSKSPIVAHSESLEHPHRRAAVGSSYSLLTTQQLKSHNHASELACGIRRLSSQPPDWDMMPLQHRGSPPIGTYCSFAPLLRLSWLRPEHLTSTGHGWTLHCHYMEAGTTEATDNAYSEPETVHNPLASRSIFDTIHAWLLLNT